jgi:hypothetical protein
MPSPDCVWPFHDATGPAEEAAQVAPPTKYGEQKKISKYRYYHSGSRPTLFFSADPIIFSTRLTVRPYFLRVVAGCCHNYWKNHEKNYFRPTDPNFFAIWNRNHRYFFYALVVPFFDICIYLDLCYIPKTRKYMHAETLANAKPLYFPNMKTWSI